MIRVGVIGLGRSGLELHARPLTAVAGYELIAVCDQSEERLLKTSKKLDARPYRDAGSLLADPKVDLIVVSVPGSLHSKLSIAALESGKHVVVEKPMADTVAEADAMLSAAERTGRILTVFHNRRWDEDYRMVKALVEQDKLGALLTIDARVMSFGKEWTSYGVPEFNPTWRVQAAYGGGFLSDWGPHLADQCLDLIGEWPEKITAELRSHMWSSEVDDYFSVRLQFPCGVLVTMEGSNNARIPLPRWFVVGREGTLISGSGFGHWTEMKLKQDCDDGEVCIAPSDVLGDEDLRDEEKYYDELSALFYADLQQALEEKKAPAITATQSRDVIALLEAARQSSESGSAVVPPEPRHSYER